MTPDKVYRIMRPEEWEAAQQSGVFTGAADDIRDGFIHLSTAAQVPGTHAKYYGGADGFLLIEIDAERLGAALRYDPSRDGQLFPHLYGPLHVSAVRSVEPLKRDPS